MTLYEYPCNERVRLLLKLEYLFDRLFFFTARKDPRQHQVAVETLFDLLDIFERSDPRPNILKDLDRQRTTLNALRLHPEVDAARLAQTLHDIQTISADLDAQGRITQPLRDNEWLSGLRGRLATPAGASQVDAPSYYDWQTQAPDARMADLQKWMQPLLTLYNSIDLLLRCLRESGNAVELTARGGTYQEMPSGKFFQLLRVWVAPAQHAFPEMSANKHMIMVRFSTQTDACKPQPVSRDVPFRLARCNL